MKYQQIGDLDQEKDRQSIVRRINTANSSLCQILLGVSVAMNVITTIMCTILFVSSQTRSAEDAIIYSPAQEAIVHETVTFRSGFDDDLSIYQGEPSSEVDDAWVELYDTWGIFRMTREQASVLPQKTAPWPGDPGFFIGELSVSHQLHCLNKLRQGLASSYYRKLMPLQFEPNGTLGKAHLSHCVESLRQALICASDVSVISWSWNEDSQKHLAIGNSVHRCRNFDSVRNWANQHSPQVELAAHKGK